MVATSGITPFGPKLAYPNTSFNAPLELAKWTVGCSKHTLPAMLYAVLSNLPAWTPSRTARFVQEGHDMKAHLVDSVFGSENANAVLLFPPHPTVAPKHDWPLRRVYNWLYTGIWNVMEMPATQVPLGLGSLGVPLGIQVVGMPHYDHLTIAMALELEKAFGGWRQPKQVVSIAH
jgi:fatty acid amide hydrolase 2